MLFDPLPFNAHSSGEKFQALQNTVLLGMLFASLRHLRILPRAAFARPYLIMCFVYVVEFLLLLRGTWQPGLDRAGGDGDGAPLSRAAVHPPRPTSSATALRLGADRSNAARQEEHGLTSHPPFRSVCFARTRRSQAPDDAST